jgi:2-methylfumaryl-CoA isomerase
LKWSPLEMVTSPGAKRVIEISAFVAAPLAGMTLAGMGCDVLRVDPPGGGLDFGRWPVTSGGDSIFWAGLNRGKRSVIVDFRRDEGRELVAEMVTVDGPEGGIFLTNLGAGGALRHERLCQLRPDVVSVQVEGYPDGRSAVDYTIAARTGIPMVTGPKGHVGPVNSPLPTWDIATGLNAVIGAQEALRRRDFTGAGALVRVALSDVARGLLASLGFVDEGRLAAEPRSRDGNYLYGAFGRDFLLADGSRVMIVAITLKQWRALVSALGMTEEMAGLERSSGLDLNREGDRFHARREIAVLIEPWCAARTSSEVAEAFDAHGVPWSPYGSAADFIGPSTSEAAGDGRSDERPDVQAGAAPEGGLVHDVGLAFRLDGEASGPIGAAPTLGQDTESVLSELLGLSQHEIGRLHDEGLVAGPGLGERMGNG